MKIRLVGIIVLVIGFCIPTFSHAQLLSIPSIDSDPVSVSVSNQSPKPGQIVTISLQSTLADLNRATIKWIIDGKTAASAIGQKSYQVAAGASGQITKITILVTIDGKTYTENTNFKTSLDVDLVWEAQSYTPPFYAGKAMFPYQGKVVIEAEPNFIRNGKRIDPKTLVYAWKDNTDPLTDGSGYGKNSITLQPNGINIRPLDISVTVSSVDNSLSGEGEITIPTQTPLGLFYITSPLYGTLYNRALASNFGLGEKEITLEMAPYFFSESSPYSTQSTIFNWSINGSPTSSQNGNTNQIVLRTPDNTSGTSQLSVKMTSSDAVLQYETGSVAIQFGNQ